MSDKPNFDTVAVHRYFSAICFNKTWEFIDRPNRTPDEELVMLQTAMTSLWHWTQREDATPQNLSVGNWQVSRVYYLLGQADNARRYAEVSLKLAEGCEPFYAAFAYEALPALKWSQGTKRRCRSIWRKHSRLQKRLRMKKINRC